MKFFVELSREAPELAQSEAAAAVAAEGGRWLGLPSPESRFAEVDLATPAAAERLAVRLALARRIVVPIGRFSADGGIDPGGFGTPSRASFRPLGHPSSGAFDALVARAAKAYRELGGRVDLDDPVERLWVGSISGPPAIYREVAAIDRSSYERRRMSRLPFQRPVALPPRLARVAANLARVGRGRRVLDPFVGTGALVAESALLGATVVGIDQSPTMIRGALRNLAYLGVSAERLVVADAASADPDAVPGDFDAIVTDPPYGRASTTLGEPPTALIARVLNAWRPRLRPDARVVLIVPDSAPPLGPSWRLELGVKVRAHRSLTREFRVYRALDPGSPPAIPGS